MTSPGNGGKKRRSIQEELLDFAPTSRRRPIDTAEARRLTSSRAPRIPVAPLARPSAVLSGERRHRFPGGGGGGGDDGRAFK